MIRGFIAHLNNELAKVSLYGFDAGLFQMMVEVNFFRCHALTLDNSFAIYPFKNGNDFTNGFISILRPDHLTSALDEVCLKLNEVLVHIFNHLALEGCC